MDILDTYQNMKVNKYWLEYKLMYTYLQGWSVY